MTISEFCTGTKEVLKVIGIVVTILKIFVPFLIIMFGMLDFGKAVVSSKEDEIKKSAQSLARRAVAGLIIFFIPNLVVWIFGTVTSFKADSKEEFTTCENCLLHPFNECE